MTKIRLATVWLDGCAGCHMSLLDMDAAVVELAKKVDIVYGPLVDAQEFPEHVDVTLVEGAVSSKHDLELIRRIRERTRVLVALGDCSITGNVPSMRNSIPVAKLLQRIYVDGAAENKGIPSDGVPALLKHACPVHEFVKVDRHVPGCPPAAQTILNAVEELLSGKKAEPAAKVRFG